MATKRAHLYISGRVQGVFYRGWAAEHAQKLGLAGWVRNLFDGRVEAVFEGPSEKIDEMIGLCHEGPAHAHVDYILDDLTEPVAGLTEFHIRGNG